MSTVKKTKPTKGEMTKRRMVSATTQLLRRNGLNGTGVLDVIRESGSPRGSLYFHFPGGKEELVISAVNRARDKLLRWIDRTSIEGFFEEYATWVETSDCRDGCPVAALATEGAAHSPRLQAAANEALSAWAAALACKLEAAGHSPQQALALGTTLICLLEGALVLVQARGDAGPLRDAYRQVQPLLVPI
jgi:TetR/AcrR family transcriptional repressor of lmrAB and yxaGH operons